MGGADGIVTAGWDITRIVNIFRASCVGTNMQSPINDPHTEPLASPQAASVGGMSQPANWYPDPTQRHELRYFDGTGWTDHVSNQGTTGTDPVQSPPPPPSGDGLDRADSAMTVGDERKKVHEQLHGTGRKGVGMTTPAPGGGTGSIFDEPVLVVNQKAKIIEVNSQYSIFDQHGTQIAAVNQVGQSKFKKVARLLVDVDQFMTHKLQITDAAGQTILALTRPRKFLKSSVIVNDASGNEIGRIVQQNAIGKIRFGLQTPDGQQVGTIKAENWRAWNFSIVDAQDAEIARVTKTWEGLAKTMFTTADNYVVQIHQRSPEPLHTLAIASALSIDTALKQDSRGLS